MRCCKWVADTLLLFLSKAHQSGGEMLLSFNSQQPPTRLHSRAQVHPHAQLPLPSDVSIDFNAGTHTDTENCMFSTLALKSLTGFLLVGHFSPSISKRWQAREKSCACMCTHTPLRHSLSHTCTESIYCRTTDASTQEVLHLSMSECEKEVEIGCTFVFSRKAINVFFVIRYLLVTQRFLLVKPLGIYRLKCRVAQAQCS